MKTSRFADKPGGVSETLEPPVEPVGEAIVRPQATPKNKKRPKRQPPYAVVLHNDDLNGMDFVVGALRNVFRYSTAKAMWLMLRAHAGGKCHVWTGVREVAELKAEQLKSCGADPHMAARGAQPLSVSVEPLPGD